MRQQLQQILILNDLNPLHFNWLLHDQNEILTFPDINADGSVSNPDLLISRTEFLTKFYCFQIEMVSCQICTHSYVLFSCLENNYDVSLLLNYFGDSRRNKLAQQEHLMTLIARKPSEMDSILVQYNSVSNNTQTSSKGGRKERTNGSTSNLSFSQLSCLLI